MNVRVSFLPSLLTSDDLHDRTLVVFDVLRATTSIIAALDAGAERVRVFGGIEDVRQAAATHPGALLCGERNCLRPDGFDLGNSPREFTRERCQRRTLLMSTTNGTHAILAARGAGSVHVAALVNTSATARMLLDRGRPITLLCAGTGGAFAIEDALGAGAVIHAIERDGSLDLANDSAQAAHALFLRLRDDLPGVLTRSQGGRNIAEAGLADDIAFAARLDRYAITAEVDMPTLAIRRHPHADP